MSLLLSLEKTTPGAYLDCSAVSRAAVEPADAHNRSRLDVSLIIYRASGSKDSSSSALGASILTINFHLRRRWGHEGRHVDTCHAEYIQQHAVVLISSSLPLSALKLNPSSLPLTYKASEPSQRPWSRADEPANRAGERCMSSHDPEKQSPEVSPGVRVPSRRAGDDVCYLPEQESDRCSSCSRRPNVRKKQSSSDSLHAHVTVCRSSLRESRCPQGLTLPWVGSEGRRQLLHGGSEGVIVPDSLL